MKNKDKMNWNLVNKLRPHNKNETLKHFLVKATTFKILIDNNYFVYSEHQLRKGRVADIFAENKETKIIVEVETKPTKKHNKELIEFYKNETLYIIDTKKISNNIIEMEEEIKFILGM